ncbi:glycoside hydrolase family 43 protein [Anaerosporobacter faecicola]|uniref:glycoside hydrolase family 43 protein n=1 Tax=Anaerosporobacter faecicola TaxID=2718714 RepID=UPI00143AA8E9|nr:glycoside hydrolase family 43 protein [Anaerosporobacter faecicola]
MIYQNPIVKGFYPDPSVCKVGDTFYMVCSSMQYFPGVPLFQSKDLINWEQIGHCLTRESQIALTGVNSSGGVFAPTIRYHEGRFYMVTTNDTTHQNFYVWTDDIMGEWSEPNYVDQGGIDPSLYFEDGRTYFMSNGSDEDGVPGIVQCEIEIETGKKLSKSKTIWQGSGGRYLEGPHLYKINGSYYLLAAEGGTEYGHMVTYARGNSIFGPFTSYASNPVLTNRNLGGYEIQGIGHGDLIEDNHGNWWIISLGFRQIGRWDTFHHLGREVFLTPVTFQKDGWFIAGEQGTTQRTVDTDRISDSVVQKKVKSVTFADTDWKKDWSYLRIPTEENYRIQKDRVQLHGTDVTLDQADSPTFLGLRQREFCAKITCDVQTDSGEAGITCYMDENHHYDLAIREKDKVFEIIERLNIGNIKSIEHIVIQKGSKIRFQIVAENSKYHFYCIQEDKESPIVLGEGLTRYLSSEVAGGFTGVMIGLYASDQKEGSFANFTNFTCEYV